MAHGESAERPEANHNDNPTSVLGQGDRIYGLIPVLEALRAGQRPIDSITIAEGARHDRLRYLLMLAKQANVPVHRVPRINLDRALKETAHQGVVARTASARYRDADELLDLLADANPGDYGIRDTAEDGFLPPIEPLPTVDGG